MEVLRKRSHGGKPSMKRPKKTSKSLPKDLLVEILAMVGSSSFTDLFLAKQSCKDFLEAAEDKYIFQRVSINKFPTIHWFPPSESVRSFLTDCFEKGNPEALYRQGMIEYFNRTEVESGMKYLKMASKKGHTEATYVYGMILLSQGDEWSRQGLKILNSLKDSQSRNWDVEDCRDKIKLVLNQMWINNTISLQEVNMECRKREHDVHRIGMLDFHKDKEVEDCDSCMWYREFVLFCRILNLRV